MKRFLTPLAPLLVTAGAVLLILTAGGEIVHELRAWMLEGGAWPRQLLLHILIVGAALLLAAAVLMTRRSAQRTQAAERARRESEERLHLIADNVPALISYVDREQRYAFSNRTYDDWFGIAHEGMQGRTVAEMFGPAYERMPGDIGGDLAGESVQFELTVDENGRDSGSRRRTLQVACVPNRAGGECALYVFELNFESVWVDGL